MRENTTNQQWRSRTPPDGILKTIAAYKRNENIQQSCARFSVKERTFYDWMDKLGVPRRRPCTRKTSPSPQVLAAANAYRDGEDVREIIANFKPSWSTLYRWLDKLEIPRRKPPRKRKAGRPLMKDLQRNCAWCKEPLSPHQVSRRRKYCCRACQDAGIEAARREKMRPCPAPGCNGLIDDDTPFCSWECHKAVMEACFG